MRGVFVYTTYVRYDIITIFPEMLDSVVNSSILGRAVEGGFIEVHYTNPRDFTTDKHNVVDDTPYGGGPGMVMKVEPLHAAIDSVVGKMKKKERSRTRVILLSAKGGRLNQNKVTSLAADYDRLVFVCGRYEGVDERVLSYIDEEISIGDYVLTGGELGAMVIVDAVSRYIPGVLGAETSLDEESHSTAGVLEYPHYTRPEEYDGHTVPEILLSGNHGAIEKWRKEQSRSTKDIESQKE